MKNEKLRRILNFFIYFLLIGIIIYNIGSVIISQKQKYLSQDYWQRFPQLKKNYLDSQYVNKHPKAWIIDEALNSYAGGEQIRGVSPILINPDTPPLGRYIIGLSALIFNNENIFNLFFVLGSLIVIYLVSRQVFGRSLWTLLPVFFFSFEPIFLNQNIFTPLLDIMQLFFLLCAFYFFNKTLLSKGKNILSFILISLFIGFFISTKFYITGITIVTAFVAVLVILRRIEDLVFFVLTLPIAIFILLLSYSRVLFDNYPFLKFLGIQKYVFIYHQSQLIHPFSIWPLLLFNKWYVWFGDQPVISDPQWRITWPLITIGSFITSITIAIKKTVACLSILPLILWIIAYLGFFSIGQISARYLVILIPIMYIVTIFGIKETIYNYLLIRKK